MHRRVAHVIMLLVLAAAPLAARENDAAPVAPSSYGPALAEMLATPDGHSQRWAQIPDLLIITSVLEYHADGPSTYTATSEQLSADEVEQLIADLTHALRTLTGNPDSRFGVVQHESARQGTSVPVLQRGRIVVGRFRGVQARTGTIGLGGRAKRSDGTITSAAVILDNDFDRTSERRHLLRAHELGHALGLNHVRSAPSIMNPAIGPEPTEFDRFGAAMVLPPAFYAAAE